MMGMALWGKQRKFKRGLIVLSLNIEKMCWLFDCQ